MDLNYQQVLDKRDSKGSFTDGKWTRNHLFLFIHTFLLKLGLTLVLDVCQTAAIGNASYSGTFFAELHGSCSLA